MKRRLSSRISQFYRKTMAERRQIVAAWTRDGSLEPLVQGGLTDADCDAMVENAIGKLAIPLGIATNFLINGQDVLVPMAIEEPSVIAAASNAARMIRAGGGFVASTDPPLTVAQIELRGADALAAEKVRAVADEILARSNAVQPQMVSLGGGAREVLVRSDVGDATRIVVHLAVDCRDAMGANTVNTMAEAIAPYLATVTGAQVGLRILTNLADRRLARASCQVPAAALARGDFSGEQVGAGIAAASDFATADPYRAATHNKGIFNGVDAVLLATGNDWRAVEAGGHAYAAHGGTYGPLGTWQWDGTQLRGEIEMPMAVGIVGGASRAHPAAAKCIEITGVTTAQELAQVAVCAGLASNLAALAALASEGIQAGHMKLHHRHTARSQP